MSDEKINSVNIGVNFLARFFTQVCPKTHRFLRIVQFFFILVILRTQDEKLHLFSNLSKIQFKSKENLCLLVSPSY